MQARMRYIGPLTLTAKQRCQSALVIVPTGAKIAKMSFVVNGCFYRLFESRKRIGTYQNDRALQRN